MSNILTIEPTEFKPLRGGESCFGYRVYDNDTSTYWFNDTEITDDDFKVMEDFMKATGKYYNNETLEYFINNLINNVYTSVCIGNKIYPYNEVNHIFEEE